MKQNGKALHRAVTAIGIVLCVVFGLLLIFNLTIIIKGLINPDWPPSVFGRTPMVVKSGSMSSESTLQMSSEHIVGLTEEQITALKPGDTFETKFGDYVGKNVAEAKPTAKQSTGSYIVLSRRLAEDHIEEDDLIFVKSVDPESLQVGQIITFMERNARGERTGSVNTHRIIEIISEDGKKAYRTKGDGNLSPDINPVKQEDIVGVFTMRVPKIGAFIFFLQKPWGMIIFIGLPVLLCIVYDVIRRQRNAKKDDGKLEELEKELARLRALEAEQNAKTSAADEKAAANETGSGDAPSPEKANETAEPEKAEPVASEPEKTEPVTSEPEKTE